jgi:YD repeat-containing protein
VLVSVTEFNADGEAYKMTDPTGKEDRVEFDDAGRRSATIDNYVNGDPGSGGFDQDVTVEFTYTADSQVETIIAKNRTTGDQTTTYTYGTDSSSQIFRNDLLVKEAYPDSPGGTDVVEYTYNRQGQVSTKIDQNGTTHTYVYDSLGRQTADGVAVALGIDELVKRIEVDYEVRGLASKITSYDADTGGNVLSEVVREYNDMAMLTKEFQSHSGAKTESTPSVSYGYDGTAIGGELINGLRPASISYPTGRSIAYNYMGDDSNHLNRINGVVTVPFGGGPLPVQTSYDYLGLGSVVELEHDEPNLKLDLIGSGNAYSGFDRFGRVVDQKWHDKEASSDVDRYQYGYDRASNRSYRQNTLTTDKDEYYSYDGVYRLRVADRGNLNPDQSGIIGTSVRKLTYESDPTVRGPEDLRSY